MLNMKIVNKESLIKEGLKTIEQYTLKNEICQVMKKEFKKIEGKKITKRVATNIENALKRVVDDSLRVSYSKDDFGWYNFNIWSSSIEFLNYNNGITLMIRESDLNEDGTFNYDNSINNKNKWLNNWNNFIEEIKNDLKMIEESNIIEEYNRAIELINNTKNSFKSGLKYRLSK